MGKNKNKLIKFIVLFCFFFVLKDKTYAAPAPPAPVPGVSCSDQGFNCTQKLIDPSNPALGNTDDYEACTSLGKLVGGPIGSFPDCESNEVCCKPYVDCTADGGFSCLNSCDGVWTPFSQGWCGVGSTKQCCANMTQIGISNVGIPDRVVRTIFGNIELGGNRASMGIFIVSLQLFLYSFAGSSAVLLILWGGYKYIMAGGNPKKVQDAKETIKWAILGLVIIISSYLIVQILGGSAFTTAFY